VSSVRRLLREQDVDEILKRLDQLAHQEAQVTELQILEAIYGLVRDMRVVMDGKQNALTLSPASC
jgi:ribosomal 50S subunit-associated protein YjgA (DUF615 family)